VSNLGKDLKAFKKSRRGPKPILQIVLDQLNLEEAKDLIEGIYDKTIPTSAIAWVLEKRGLPPISHSIVMNYRYGRTTKPDLKYFR
jgi:hypothetical protein